MGRKSRASECIGMHHVFNHNSQEWRLRTTRTMTGPRSFYLFLFFPWSTGLSIIQKLLTTSVYNRMPPQVKMMVKAGVRMSRYTYS